jgi:hypothetical protein
VQCSPAEQAWRLVYPAFLGPLSGRSFVRCVAQCPVGAARDQQGDGREVAELCGEVQGRRPGAVTGSAKVVL